MKRFFKFFAVIALSGITVASCYDDSALQASIKELQDQMKEANKVLDDLKSGKVITSVSATDNGYTF